MKRINVLFLAFTLIFIACSKSTLEDKAIERISKLTDESLGGVVKSHSTDNYETVFCDDSICIIHYDVNYTTFSDERISFKAEYYIMWDVSESGNPKLVETDYDLSEKKSIIDRASKFFEQPVLKLDDAAYKLRASAGVFDFFIWNEINGD